MYICHASVHFKQVSRSRITYLNLFSQTVKGTHFEKLLCLLLLGSLNTKNHGYISSVGFYANFIGISLWFFHS